MLSCYIVSDASTVEVLSGYILKNSCVLKGYGTSMEKSSNEILICKPDLVYLDLRIIQHHQLEFNVLRQVCSIILLLDRIEDACNALDRGAIDFIVKPIEYKRFLKGIEGFRVTTRVILEHTSVPSLSDFFFIKTATAGMKELRICYADIIFVEAMQNYVLFHTDGCVYTSLTTLREIESHLPAMFFSRIHKSIIINDSKIESIEGNAVNIINNSRQFHIGHTYRNSFFEKINRWMVAGQRRRISS